LSDKIYHGPGQANGLCFSVSDGIPKPPSLQNIFKEIKAELGLEIPITGNLECWAKQGIFMLNAMLTVRARQAASHQKFGWQHFTDAAIKALSDHREGIVFLLWGKFAQGKAKLIDEEKHKILQSPHPSPFSAYSGFFGNGHFAKTNELLVALNLEPIDWHVS
ncbi:UNVERIFIED_CONTAM: hypothetical protein GTU68_025741, partial [Idotea baltica]|nr:hypothetical protein [Idotea baltica]